MTPRPAPSPRRIGVARLLAVGAALFFSFILAAAAAPAPAAAQ